MSQRGFRGFRKPEQITNDSLAASIERMGVEGRYIYWTGGAYKARAHSLRSNALACITEKKRPISMKLWLTRAARVVGPDQGYKPERAREGLYLHKGSKPSVYFELERDKDGNYRSVNDCPNADGFPKGLKRGDIVVSGKAQKEQPTRVKGKGKAPATPEAPSAPEPQADAPQA